MNKLGALSKPVWMASVLTLALIAVAWGAREVAGVGRSPADLARELPSTAADKSAAATVDGQAITVGRVVAYEALSAQTAASGLGRQQSRAEIVDGLINDELLYQEAVRRGLGVSDAEAAAALEAARKNVGAKEMEFILAYGNQHGDGKLDANSYWSTPAVLAAYKRSLTVQALVDTIAAGGSPGHRETLVAAEVSRLRAMAAIDIAPSFR